MKPVYSRLLALSVVFSVLVSLGMDRRTRQGYRILIGIAIRAYDGDAVAMRRLVSSARSTDQDVARYFPWLLSMSLNPDNISILAEIYEETEDENIRAAVAEVLSRLRNKYDGRDVVRAAKRHGGKIGTLAEELLAIPCEVLNDEVIRLRLLHEVSRDKAYRDRLFAEFERTTTLPERIEILRKLYPMGEERLIPYIDGLLAQMQDTSGGRFAWSRSKYLLSAIIRRVSLRKASELPVIEKRDIYERVLSAVLKEESSLLDLSGQPVKLKSPHVPWNTKRDRVVYVNDINLEGIQELRLEGYKFHIMSKWKIKGIANKRKYTLLHLSLGRFYSYLDHAVVGIGFLPTTCIRHPGPWLCGSGTEILLKKKNGDWRFQAVLSSWIS